MYVIEIYLIINLIFFPFGQILIQCEILKLMFKVKYGVNKMHSITFSQQVGWFDGKRIDIHPCSLRTKMHK